MTVQEVPQELCIFSVAFVMTGDGTQRRPRLLILSAPSVEGADPAKIAQEWISAAKTATSFPVVHDLHANTGLELAPASAMVAPERPRAVPEVRINREHPAFGPLAEDEVTSK